jgi:beta-lactamase class A
MLAELERSITLAAESVKADWGIYVKFLGSGEEIAVNADEPMDTMSVIKVPLLVTLMREAAAGRVDLSRRITLETRHRRWGTSVLRFLDDGLSLSLRDAALLMIALSDNTATDICYEAVGGPARVTAQMRELGLMNIEACGTAYDWLRALTLAAHPEVEALGPEELYRFGYPAPPPIGTASLPPMEAAAVRLAFHFRGEQPFGLASARDMGTLLEMIQTAQCASRESCDAMISMLRAQQFTSRIPKYLEGALIAHKTGDFGPFIANDVGIIQPYGRPPFIACFMTAKFRGNWPIVEDTIARMSEMVWEYGRWSS